MLTCTLFAILAEDKLTYEPCSEDDETCKNVFDGFYLVPIYARTIDNENGGKYCYMYLFTKEMRKNNAITKTCPCNVNPLEPHFYIVKLGFAGVCLFFLFLLQNIVDCGYSLEPPHRGVSNVYPQSMF